MKVPAKKQKNPALGLARAMEAMRRPDSRLVKMHQGVGGFAFYVVPGGPVEREVADKIKSHPLVRPGADGLFPGHDQTWRMVVDSALSGGAR
jgi:hypothetical protein